MNVQGHPRHSFLEIGVLHHDLCTKVSHNFYFLPPRHPCHGSCLPSSKKPGVISHSWCRSLSTSLSPRLHRSYSHSSTETSSFQATHFIVRLSFLATIAMIFLSDSESFHWSRYHKLPSPAEASSTKSHPCRRNPLVSSQRRNTTDTCSFKAFGWSSSPLRLSYPTSLLLLDPTFPKQLVPQLPLQWDCILVSITRTAIYPHQGGAFALHYPIYNPKLYSNSHVFRSRYSVIVGNRLFLNYDHYL